MKWACERLKGIWRIIGADIFLFVSFVGTVNGKLSRVQVSTFNSLILLSRLVWRGIWTLLDLYFLPGEKEYSRTRS